MFTKSSSLSCHNIKRQFSKESSSSASDLHSQVSQTLRTTTPSTSTTPATAPALDPDAPRGVAQQIFRHPDRRARYNQAVWNAGVAFMLMLMAAQSLKASRERRRVTAELLTVEKQSAERLASLQVLFEDDTIEKLVHEIVQARQEGTSQSWLGKKQSSSEAEKLRLTHVLLRNLDELVGSTALDEAQREALRMRLVVDEVASEPVAVKKVIDVGEASGPPKRVPFTM